MEKRQLVERVPLLAVLAPVGLSGRPRAALLPVVAATMAVLGMAWHCAQCWQGSSGITLHPLILLCAPHLPPVSGCLLPARLAARRSTSRWWLMPSTSWSLRLGRRCSPRGRRGTSSTASRRAQVGARGGGGKEERKKGRGGRGGRGGRKKERREGLLETKALGGAVGCHGCVSTVAKRPSRWKHTLALTLAAAAAAAAACRPTCLPACSGGDVRRRGG